MNFCLYGSGLHAAPADELQGFRVIIMREFEFADLDDACAVLLVVRQVFFEGPRPRGELAKAEGWIGGHEIFFLMAGLRPEFEYAESVPVDLDRKAGSQARGIEIRAFDPFAS